MVAAVREGLSLRYVARLFRVAVSTVFLWVHRAVDRRLDEMDWRDRPDRPHHVYRTPKGVEARVLEVRRELREESALGEFGAAAVHQAMQARGYRHVPSMPTISQPDLPTVRRTRWSQANASATASAGVVSA